MSHSEGSGWLMSFLPCWASLFFNEIRYCVRNVGKLKDIPHAITVFLALAGVLASKKRWNECLGLSVPSIAIGEAANCGKAVQKPDFSEKLERARPLSSGTFTDVNLPSPHLFPSYFSKVNLRRYSMRYFTLLAALLPCLLFSQNDDKRDYTWLFGYPPNNPNEGYGGTRIHFAAGQPLVSYFNLNYDFQTSSMISNSDGNLEFYTNGCHIINRENKIMLNGSPLNPGEIFDGYCSTGGYPLSQSCISLPYPDSPGVYAAFHLTINYLNNGSYLACNKMLLTKVDMNQNNGLGKVTMRNQLLSDQLFSSCLTAVRHGNGRDWWVVVPGRDGKKCFSFLLSAQGITGPIVHNFVNVVEPQWNGQIAFSADGSWLADCQGSSQMRLMRFDRCTGEIYDEQAFDFQGDTVEVMGVAFSPNSHVLYVSSPVKIYQYDLMASNIPASRQVVAEYDGFAPNGFSTTFFQQMLAPNHKIYLTATNSTRFLHIIHAPDSLGTACNVEQHGLQMATRHAFMMPNFPHFRLYDLADSPCDTLGINGPVSGVAEEPSGRGEVTNLHLWPVPAVDLLTVQFDDFQISCHWTVSDLSGRELLRGNVEQGIRAVEISMLALPSGAYAFCFRGKNGQVVNRLFTVVRA